ncbi:hypothetical protein AURDEDRAFT_115064 [Auricularia subglabra TFB-10046 SS5]|nr:hypothetical protein AURDEDRAFT_115064 [Auricularia subglabra TFB-10046 SS5]
MDYPALLSERVLSHAFNWLDLNSLVRASHVSQRWRKLARAHPSYWQRIVLVDTNQYDDSKTRISAHKVARFCDQLAVGGRRPITVNVDINFGCTDVETDVFAHINTHLPRVAALTLHIPDITFVDEFSALSKPAPMLHSLHIWLYHLDCDPSNGHEIPPALFAGTAPRLYHVILQDIDIMPAQPPVPAFNTVHHAQYFAVDKDAEYPAPTLQDLAQLFPNCHRLVWTINDFAVREDSPDASPTAQQPAAPPAHLPSSADLTADALDVAGLGGFPLASISSVVITAADIEDACLRDLLKPRRSLEQVYLILDRRGAEDTTVAFAADGRSREVRIALVRQPRPLPVLKPCIRWERVCTLRVVLTDLGWKFLVQLCDAVLPSVRRIFFTLRGKIPAISRLKAIVEPLSCHELENVYFDTNDGQRRKLRQSWVQSLVTTRLCPVGPVHVVFDNSIEVEVDLPGAVNETDGWERTAVSAVSRVYVV